MKSWLTAFLLVIFAASAAAQNSAGPREGQLYINGGAIFYDFPVDAQLGDTTAPAVGFGYGLSENWSAEVMYSWFDAELQFPGATGEDKTELLWLDFVYQIPGFEKWQPFWLIGGGQTQSHRGTLKKNDDNQFNAGFGLFRALGDHLALRGDVRAVYSDDANEFQPFASVGLTAFLGDVTPPAPVDTDGDGVADPNDRCPNTPPGVDVDNNGCELDSDGDGVVDGADQCPNTPQGAAVDSRGCPLDSDQDGVPDYKDECPDSARGAKVDERGCYIELEKPVTIDLNLQFDYNSAQLRPEHSAEIQRAVEFLRQYPTAKAVIEGHTDSDGAAEYNQALSERRAAAVRTYLVETAGIAASRLTSIGYGETKPLVSNDSQANKQRNRRVAVVVSGTQMVRQ